MGSANIYDVNNASCALPSFQSVLKQTVNI